MKLVPTVTLSEVLDDPNHPWHRMVIWWQDEDGTQSASYCGTYLLREQADYVLRHAVELYGRPVDNLDEAVRLVHDEYHTTRVRNIQNIQAQHATAATNPATRSGDTR